MRDDLLEYYERELSFLRRTGAEFARNYPRVASQLALEPTKCDDPHVERLLEGFAFLAARVHLRVDDDFPELTEALLNVVYPHYIRPIPSMSVAEFRLDSEQGRSTSGLTLPRGTQLYSRPVGGAPCRFQTCYPTTLWPVTLTGTKWVVPQALRPAVRTADAVGALRFALECLPDITFGELDLETLRLHLSAEPTIASALYELLCNSCSEILIRDPGDPERAVIRLPGDALRPVGFESDEGMLPQPRRSFVGHRLLQEYFGFPAKFFFLDLPGFDRLRAARFGGRAEVVCLFSSFERAERRDQLEVGVTDETVRLGCTPIVNLFPKTSEPVLLTQRRQEHRIVADARRRASTGVFSVDDVVAVTPGASEPLRFDPLYSFRHGRNGHQDELFWYARRRPTGWRADEGTDVFLSFVDHTGRTADPGSDAVTARLTCYNRDLPSRLPFGDQASDFELPHGGPIERIVALTRPTEAIEPPLGKSQLWRLISQLSLNYLSLVEGGPEALQELLRLHNFGDTTAGERQIQGIRALSSGPCFARIESEHGLTFARGQRVELELDEEQFAGGGVYLFASILERFLGLGVSLNSFCVLAARTRQRKEILREWPPRAGSKVLR